MPSSIETVHRELSAGGLEVLAIDIQESPEKVAAWVKQKRVTSRVLLDADGATARAYGVTATPTVFLIGRDGRLVAKAVGMKPWTGEPGRELLRTLLAR